MKDVNANNAIQKLKMLIKIGFDYDSNLVFETVEENVRQTSAFFSENSPYYEIIDINKAESTLCHRQGKTDEISGARQSSLTRTYGKPKT